MPIDTALVGALHVEYLRERDFSGDEHLHHTLFQTSTIDALLEGKYEGDVSFAELGDRGDFGLGTFDALDGEMVCLDCFWAILWTFRRSGKRSCDPAAGALELHEAGREADKEVHDVKGGSYRASTHRASFWNVSREGIEIG